MLFRSRKRRKKRKRNHIDESIFLIRFLLQFKDTRFLQKRFCPIVIWSLIKEPIIKSFNSSKSPWNERFLSCDCILPNPITFLTLTFEIFKIGYYLFIYFNDSNERNKTFLISKEVKDEKYFKSKIPVSEIGRLIDWWKFNKRK